MASNLDKLVIEISKFLDKHKCSKGVRIFLENQCWEKEEDEWKAISNLPASRFIEKANNKTINMTFEEEPFYNIINRSGNPFINEEQIEHGFYLLLQKHGYFYEQHNLWNLYITN